MQRLKSTLAIFTLSVFLLNYAAREYHKLSHFQDIPCNSTQGHIHPAKPHCNLCEFTDETASVPSFDCPDFCLSEPVSTDFIFPESVLLLQEKDFHALRAPPSLA